MRRIKRAVIGVTGWNPAMSREPLAVVGAVVAFLQGLLTTVVLMGWWALTPEQTAAWVGLIALGGTAAVVVISRGKVTPVANPRDADGQPLATVREVPLPPLTQPQDGDILRDL